MGMVMGVGMVMGGIDHFVSHTHPMGMGLEVLRGGLVWAKKGIEIKMG